MFINKINNFYENNTMKNREDWFGKDELKSEFDISSRHQSEDELDDNNTFIKRVTTDESEYPNGDQTTAKEERRMIEKSKI
jgi:hypothetical protein